MGQADAGCAGCELSDRCASSLARLVKGRRLGGWSPRGSARQQSRWLVALVVLGLLLSNAGCK